MKVRILGQVNSHWLDGRHFSAMPGTVTEVDDADTDAVAHMRYLVRTGQAEIVDEPPLEKTVEPETVEPETVEPETGIKPVKATRTRRAG